MAEHFIPYRRPEEGRAKPCPFCGGTDLAREYSMTGVKDIDEVTIRCWKCGTTFELQGFNPLKLWNTRWDGELTEATEHNRILLEELERLTEENERLAKELADMELF